MEKNLGSGRKGWKLQPKRKDSLGSLSCETGEKLRILLLFLLVSWK